MFIKSLATLTFDLIKGENPFCFSWFRNVQSGDYEGITKKTAYLNITFIGILYIQEILTLTNYEAKHLL